MPRRVRYWMSCCCAALSVGCAAGLAAQTAGAAPLHQMLNALTVTSRVLVIGAHPDDDDSRLVAWLARGHGVEAGYLSLSRGEGGLNYLGPALGTVLGAVRTQEVLAARQIDGGVPFFARAWDFGPARSAAKALEHWPHEMLLGDVVAVIRSFRPQVVVSAFSDSVSDGNGQHAAVMVLAREAMRAAADTSRFPIAKYGPAWTPQKLYAPGAGLAIDAGQYDPVLGQTFADIAAAARAQYRSQGLTARPVRRSEVLRLARADAASSITHESSIFDGVDTTMKRLVLGATDEVARLLPLTVAYADSARTAADLEHPTRIVRYLARAAEYAAQARVTARRCRHPSADAMIVVPMGGAQPACDIRAMDLDASIDLMLHRTTRALLLAAGISFDASADREFVADGDATPVTVTTTNHGDSAVTLLDVTISNAPHVRQVAVVIPPDSAARSYALASSIAELRPWWFGSRSEDLFPPSNAAIDGLVRTDLVPELFTVPGVVLPENMRRLTDVSVTLAIAGTTISTSIGPVVYHYADPVLGLQDREVSGVPPVMLSFERNLEWVRSAKPIDRRLRLTLRSFSDGEQKFSFKFVAPPGVRIDSVPAVVTLAPREQRELFLRMHGSLDSGRASFGAVGTSASSQRFVEGMQTLQYPHVRPIHVFHSSAFWMQAVKIDVPSRLNALYVSGLGDDIPGSLQQIGIPVSVVTADELLSADLAHFTTIVLGPRAFEAQRTLGAQNGRLLDFVRKGGALVMLQDESPRVDSRPIPFPITVARLRAERVAMAESKVTVLTPRSRLLSWPNAITDEDWSGWSGDRASLVPTAADPRYAHVVEMHDPGEPENANTILTANVGKGVFVYTTLTFQDQIAAGVPGSLRLFVNLLSAGLAPEARR